MKIHVLLRVLMYFLSSKTYFKSSLASTELDLAVYDSYEDQLSILESSVDILSCILTSFGCAELVFAFFNFRGGLISSTSQEHRGG